MLKIEVKKKTGEKLEDLKLDQTVFGVDINDNLIHQVYIAQASNRRKLIAHTKNRSERKGSSKKPWRQKGTGRARVGTAQNPIWRKGGVAFGPSNERNFKKKINKKMKHQAIKMVLSGKLKDKEIVVLSDNEFKDKKTKNAKNLLEKFGVEKTVLWAFDKKELENQRVSRNLQKVQNIFVDKLNVYDLLNNKYLILTKEGIGKIEKKYK